MNRGVNSSAEERPLFAPGPGEIRGAQMSALREEINRRHQAGCENFRALHQWAVLHPELFWPTLRDFCGVIGDDEKNIALENGDDFIRSKWFPHARLNFAENLLWRRDDSPAIIAHGENKNRRELSFKNLHSLVARIAATLDSFGVGVGDRVAGLLPNSPEAIAAMLAAASKGAIWSGCSPDFGADGIAERFGQIQPKILFAADGYFYGGKRFDALAKLKEAMPRIDGVEKIILLRYAGNSIANFPHPTIDFSGIAESGGVPPLRFSRLPFNHPLYIMYSSGTTGKPKCIVHGAGGTLLEHLKELRLHVDLRRDSRIFFFTTCGWMMWHWTVSALAVGACICTYDGSPMHPAADSLFDLIEAENVNVFGTSARYLSALEKAGAHPAANRRLKNLRTILSTGSPLAAESYDFARQKIKGDLRLQSISGGTDIIGCFALGNPTLPIYRGEIQGPSLGLDVAVFNDDGKSVVGERGELVCRRTIPSKPLGFWDDESGEKFRAAYFSRFPNVWTHGDFAEWRRRKDGCGMVIHGRSDATLNPGGVRIGTAEIYRQAESFDEVAECLAVGMKISGDEQVILFVRIADGFAMSDSLSQRIKERIRLRESPRHVPSAIVAAPDLPRTVNGKLAELAAKSALAGETPKNLAALANPESLSFFQIFADKGKNLII